VGRLTNLYPSDPWQAALCGEIMEAVQDITSKIAATMFLSDEQKKVQRKALVEGPLPFYLARLQQRLEAHGGRYFAGGKLSVADLKVFVLIRQLKSGVLDHVPADLPDRIAPKLIEHYERIKNQPGVKDLLRQVRCCRLTDFYRDASPKEPRISPPLDRGRSVGSRLWVSNPSCPPSFALARCFRAIGFARSAHTH